jgi:hypothetical protein
LTLEEQRVKLNFVANCDTQRSSTLRGPLKRKKVHDRRHRGRHMLADEISRALA